MGQVIDWVKKWQNPDGKPPVAKQGLPNAPSGTTRINSPNPSGNEEELLKQKQAQRERVLKLVK